MNGGDEKTLIFKNSKKPLLTISKVDAISGDPVPGTVLTVEGINSDYQHLHLKTGGRGNLGNGVLAGVQPLALLMQLDDRKKWDLHLDRTEKRHLYRGGGGPR